MGNRDGTSVKCQVLQENGKLENKLSVYGEPYFAGRGGSSSSIIIRGSTFSFQQVNQTLNITNSVVVLNAQK